jgi:hypothetical protein
MPTEHSGSAVGSGSRGGAATQAQSSTNANSHAQNTQSGVRPTPEEQTNPYLSATGAYGKDAKRESYVLNSASAGANAASGSGAVSGSTSRHDARQSRDYSRSQANAMAGSAPPLTKSDSSREQAQASSSKYDVSRRVVEILECDSVLI